MGRQRNPALDGGRIITPEGWEFHSRLVWVGGNGESIGSDQFFSRISVASDADLQQFLSC